MQEQAVWRYVSFGTTLRFLQDAQEGWRIHGDVQVLTNLQRFFGYLDELGLVVTRNVANAERLQELVEEFEEASANARLTTDQATDLRKRVTNVRKTLAAESRELKAFVTSSKRWEVDRLLHSPGEMFGQGIYPKLDSQAAFDFEEACKCIAFERSTAAGFHIMRGTEAVLRSFYCHVVKQNRLKKRAAYVESDVGQTAGEKHATAQSPAGQPRRYSAQLSESHAASGRDLHNRSSPGPARVGDPSDQ